MIFQSIRKIESHLEVIHLLKNKAKKKGWTYYDRTQFLEPDKLELGVVTNDYNDIAALALAADKEYNIYLVTEDGKTQYFPEETLHIVLCHDPPSPMEKQT